MGKIVSKVEGDVNISPIRQLWQENNLSQLSKKLINEDRQYFLEQALSTPCLDVVKSVDGIYLIDWDDRKIMDFHGNSVHQLGYNHPKLVEVMKMQLEELSFSPRRFCNVTATKLAKKLCDLMPSDGYRVLFTTSGAASNEVALKLVRMVKKKHKVISFWNSFHGANIGSVSVGGSGHFRNDLGPLMTGVEHIMEYNSYRSILGEGEVCEKISLDYLESICEIEGDVGAIITEPIRCTDVQIPPVTYHKRLRGICDKYDIALIYDEIPTAFGRTGKMFAFEHYGIEPDIVTVGKGLGGSLVPFSAVIAREEYNKCQTTSLGHYTHEKNPIGSAVALSLIECLEVDGILDRVSLIERIMKEAAEEMKKKYSVIGDVRCLGGMLAIELVKNRLTKEKAVEEAERVLYECLENGLSFKISNGNILTLFPPLIIEETELRRAMKILENALKERCI